MTARSACVWGLLLAAAVSAVWAQKPKVETFSADEGLPSAYVEGLAQDGRSGRLAILTRAGVTLYDGESFTTQTDGLPGGRLGAITVGPDGRLWTVVRRNAPLVCWLETTWHCSSSLSPDPSKPSSDKVVSPRSLAVAEQGGHAVAVAGSFGAGLWRWNEEDEEAGRAAWRSWQSADGLPSDDARAVAAVTEGFAVATTEGLCFLRRDDLDCRIRERFPKLRDPIIALHTSQDDQTLWILGNDWLGRLAAGSLDVLADGLDLPWPAEVSEGSLVTDSAGSIYFGTPIVAYLRDSQDGRITRLEPRQGLASNGVTALLHDREANVWVGSSRGLSRIASRRFLSFDESQGLLEDEVSALVEALPGRFVLGHNIGLTLLTVSSPSTTVHLPFGAAPTADGYRVMDLAPDPDGSVWVAANTLGLLQLEPPFRSPRPPTLQVRLAVPGILSVEFDAAGRLWALSKDHLFVRRDGRFVEVDHGHGDVEALRRLDAAEDGRLFVSAARGLLVYDGTEWRLAKAADPDANILYGVHAASSDRASSDTVWVGTLDGLYQLRDGELVRAREGALRVDRPVYFLLEDEDSRLWVGTDDGVRVWDGAQLRYLSVPQGLAGRETNRAAGILDHRGRVWIGTDRGVSTYLEPYDQPHRAPPLVELGAVEVNGREQPFDGELRLAPHQKNLTFHFRAVTFSTESSVVVRYRLDPFDSAWSTRVASAGEIRYTNVPAGRYRFHIAAGWADDQDDAWSAEVSSPEIALPRPLWQEPWLHFLSVLALILSVAGWYGLRNRDLMRRAREREALIAELEARNAELERFTYTVSHDLKSPLFTIKGFLGLLRRDAAQNSERMEHDIRQIEDATDKMGRLLSELLELYRIGRIVQPAQRVALGELVTEALALAAGAVAERGVEVEVAPDLPAVEGDRVRLREVFQNLIDNAVRFMGDEARPRIEIGARSHNGEHLLFVRDNGIGIDPSYHDKVFGLFERLDAKVEGTGIGLALVKRIVELHGGRIWVESEGRGRGSRFCFTLPRSDASG